MTYCRSCDTSGNPHFFYRRIGARLSFAATVKTETGTVNGGRKRTKTLRLAHTPTYYQVNWDIFLVRKTFHTEIWFDVVPRMQVPPSPQLLVTVVDWINV